MDIEELRKTIAFVDVEASGLMEWSFPVECAWITNEGEGSILIDPTNHWNENCWDQDAEAMHGLMLHELRKKGKSPAIVAQRLERAFAGRTVFSDSPAHDENWLDMIHEKARRPRPYRVETIGKLLGRLKINASDAYALFEEARNTHPPRGRAIRGARHLQAIFENALKRTYGL